MDLRRWADEALAEATGRERRFNPVLPRTGGPAGNAQLTAWTGLLLLVLFLVEVATVLDLNGLLSWHIVVGVLLVPPALLKTAATGWRMMHYYTGRQPYHRAGPPPMLLRVLGPLVVLCTLGVLGSGLWLIAIGPAGSRSVLFTALGHRVSSVTMHGGIFVLWAAVTTLHTVGRLVPAAQIVLATQSRGNPVHGRLYRALIPGRLARAAVVAGTLVVAGLAAAVLFGSVGSQVPGYLSYHADQLALHATK